MAIDYECFYKSLKDPVEFEEYDTMDNNDFATIYEVL